MRVMIGLKYWFGQVVTASSPVSSEMGDRSSWYVTSHSSQLSFLLLARQKMSTGHGAVAVLTGWKGNDRICGVSIYGLNGQMKRDEHPAYTPPWNMASFTFYKY